MQMCIFHWYETLPLPSPTPAPRSFIPPWNAAFTGHAGSGWAGGGGRCWAASGRVPVIDSTESEWGGGEGKKINWAGRSLFLARRKTDRRCDRWGLKHHLSPLVWVNFYFLQKERTLLRVLRCFRSTCNVLSHTFRLRERRDRHYCTTAVARHCAMNENCFWRWT